MPSMLIVLTSHATLGDTGRPTGFHWEELATPYWIFRDAGFEVELASIAGGPVPHDPSSLKAEVEANKPSVVRFVQDATAMAALRDARAVSEAEAARYDGVFLPGGHGTMWDLPNNAALASLIGRLFDDGRAVSAVCHGPAGLVGAKRADGQPIVQGRRVNSFTDAEEAAINLTAVMPFLLESRLRELGAIFEGGPNFQPYAVRDGNLVTGQNPASAEAVARQVVDVVREREDTVTVTLRLVAKDRVATLALLDAALPATRAADGCRYSQTFVDHDAPNVILLVQGWASAAHQARYLAWRERTGDLGALVATLSTPPEVTLLGRLAA